MCGVWIQKFLQVGPKVIWVFRGRGGDLKRILGNFINKCKFKEILPPPTLPPDLRMITRTSIL